VWRETAASSITKDHESELRTLAVRVLPLLSAAEKEDRPIFDYLVGALHALLRARELNFKDRPGPFADGYWRRGPTDTARSLQDGVLRTDGRWLAGFYFNSALARTAATFERFIGVARAARRGKDRDAEERRIRQQCPHAVRVANEVNKLKHHRPGVASGRDVKAEDAVAALREVVELAEGTVRS
jgi:hypothetical protein